MQETSGGQGLFLAFLMIKKRGGDIFLVKSLGLEIEKIKIKTIILSHTEADTIAVVDNGSGSKNHTQI